jgi:drug/metabolite transporter (DMT)-like permease
VSGSPFTVSTVPPIGAHGPIGWAQNRALVVLAVGYQWSYSGANFVAFKIGGDALNPLMLAAMRFTIAAALVLPLAAWRWRSRPARIAEVGSAAALGVVMLAGGQTLGMVGTHLLPAGVASVFGSASPIFLAIFAWAIMGEPLRFSQACGVGLGFVGLALMAYVSSAHGGFSPLGAGLALAASASRAAGSLWSGRLRLPDDPVVVLATQLSAGALVLGAVAGATGAAAHTDLTHLSAEAWWVLAYLIVASTLIGYAVFFAVNADVSPTVANSFCYAAPVIALLLSAVVLGEPLSLVKLLAALIALSGVALMVRGPVDHVEA